MGFEEISHTADWSVRVWAEDLPSLFAESARAMNTLAGVETGTSLVLSRVEGPRVKRVFESEGPDAESLLVAFLSELVYCQEQENLAFDLFELKVEEPALTGTAVSKGQTLKVKMVGAEILSMDKAIKAVTYHNLRIERTSRGLEVTLVFDV